MKLYSNYDKKELKRFFLSMCLFIIIVYTPIYYFVEELFLPFNIALNEFMLFAAQDDYLNRFFDYYENNKMLSNLDEPSLILFLVFQHTGGVLIPAFILFFYLIIIPRSVLYLFKKAGLIKKEGFKVSRKPFTRNDGFE